MFIRKVLLILFISLIHLTGKAQTQELRTLFLQQISLNHDWTTIFDGGYYQGLGDAEYHRWGLRNSTRYRLNGTFVVDAGFMYNRVNRPEVGIENEFRPHQSLRIAYPRYPHMTINHRFRLEERFITHSYNDKTNITSRFRYQVGTRRAFDPDKNIEPNTMYWKASGEITFNVLGNIIDDYTFFQRGRYGLGLGYQLNTKLSIEGTLYYQRSYNNTNFDDFSDTTIFNFYIRNKIFWNKEKN
ncbi:DUF2490 domain-containing protein [Labilibacter sediminis]|nr:DUF2490 domain-containing protein [Labilibacter sediminis]